MILSQDINKISKKLGWDPEIVQYSIDKLIKDKVVDSDILPKKNVIEFLKICSESKDVEDRKEKLIKFFRTRLNKNIVKTIIYFSVYDAVFICVWHYFDYLDDSAIEGNIYKPTKEAIRENLNPLLLIGWMCRFNPSEVEEKREKIVERLIYDNTSRFIDYEKLDKLIYDLVSEIGFKFMKIESLREYFLQGLEANRVDFEDKIIKQLLFYKKKKGGTQHWFYYFLVEELKERGYGTRESFRLVGKLLDKPSSSIQRRYYDKLKEIKDNNLDTKKIIQELNLENRLIHERKQMDHYGKEYFDIIEEGRKFFRDKMKNLSND